jgi:hypothetical protein
LPDSTALSSTECVELSMAWSPPVSNPVIISSSLHYGFDPYRGEEVSVH